MKKYKIKKTNKKFKRSKLNTEICENYYVTNDVKGDGRGETWLFSSICFHHNTCIIDNI